MGISQGAKLTVHNILRTEMRRATPAVWACWSAVPSIPAHAERTKLAVFVSVDEVV